MDARTFSDFAIFTSNKFLDDFNFDLLKVSENDSLLNHFMEYVQIVNKPTRISGSLIDHVYIKKTLMEKFSANATVEIIYFSDHDAIRIVIEKNNADFQTIYSINDKPDIIPSNRQTNSILQTNNNLKADSIPQANSMNWGEGIGRGGESRGRVSSNSISY